MVRGVDYVSQAFLKSSLQRWERRERLVDFILACIVVPLYCSLASSALPFGSVTSGLKISAPRGKGDRNSPPID
jgi:hypothetical protein